MEIYFITGSTEKFNEVREFLKETVELRMLPLDLPEIQEIDSKKIIEAKLKTAAELYPDKKLIVEDTSLHFDCLNGLPGPLIKWFAKKMGFDGLYNICDKLGDFNAEAKAIIGLNIQGKMNYFEGSIKGKIVPPKGEGYGWDEIFMPEGHKKRFSEMTLAEKNQISHRANAVKKLISSLQK